MFEAGANYFILSVKPRLLVPMHYFHKSDIAVEYARTASCRTTEVLAMPGIGDSIRIQLDDSGFMDISFPKLNPLVKKSSDEELSEQSNLELDEMTGENPFSESDLPLSQLANSSKPEEE